MDQAEIAFAAVDKVLRGTKDREAHTILQINRGELALASHDISEAHRRFAAAEDLLRPSSSHFFRTFITAGYGICALHNGDIAEARRMESDLPKPPDFWTHDPTIVTAFKARMFVMRRDFPRAIGLLEEVRAAIRDRFITAWVRLALEECRILKKTTPPKAIDLAREGLELAEGLELFERARQFRGFLESAGRVGHAVGKNRT
ncbi:hypothetical protein ACFL3Z_01830 [Gemmatimonadota bacterium]